MQYFLSILGIIGAVAMLKYRQKIGDEIGEADWMMKVGGVYNFIIIVAIVIFFWSFMTLTGTADVFFGWLKFLIPGAHQTPVDAGAGI